MSAGAPAPERAEKSNKNGTIALEAENVYYSYSFAGSTLEVLSGADLSLSAHHLLLLEGPSGSGKTTFLSILAGLIAPLSGRVTLAGADLGGLDAAGRAKARRNTLGLVLQTAPLFPALTAFQNIVEVLRLHGKKRPLAEDLAARSLIRVGLGARLDHLPAALSVGERQRVAVARALAADPKVILADEPTAALDPKSAVLVMDLLRSAADSGAAVLVVTHDRRLRRYSDRQVALSSGKVTEVDRDSL